MLKDCNHPTIDGTSICASCPPPDDWNKHARCLDANPDLFYCDNDDFESVKQAVRICMSCPVRGFCLEAGFNDKWGIWGSFTAPERERLRKVFPVNKRPAKERRTIIRTIAHRL